MDKISISLKSTLQVDGMNINLKFLFRFKGGFKKDIPIEVRKNKYKLNEHLIRIRSAQNHVVLSQAIAAIAS